MVVFVIMGSEGWWSTRLPSERMASLNLKFSFTRTCEIFRRSWHSKQSLDRRSTPRARELRGKVRQQVVSLSAIEARDGNAKPWYRRGVVWLAGLVVAGVAQGIFHAAGFHMWEPMLRKVQELVPFW